MVAVNTTPQGVVFQMTDIIDIKTRKSIERIEADENSSVSQYMTFWKQKCKERKVKTILIMTVDEDDMVAWDIKPESDEHMLRLQSCLKHVDNFLDAMIWPEPDDEIEVEFE